MVVTTSLTLKHQVRPRGMEPGCEEDSVSITTERTVRELALENPAATRVFEKLGIDYCCGGNKSLEQACRAANLPLDKVLDSLESAAQSAQPVQKDHKWPSEMLADLAAYISEHPSQVHA